MEQCLMLRPGKENSSVLFKFRGRLIHCNEMPNELIFVKPVCSKTEDPFVEQERFDTYFNKTIKE